MRRLIFLAALLASAGLSLIAGNGVSLAQFSTFVQGPAAAASAYAPVGSPSTGSSFSGSTIAITRTGTVAGHAILGTVAINPTSGTLSISGTCALGTGRGSGNARQSAAFYCINIAGGSLTVTVTSTSTITDARMELEEWSGVATSSAYDGDNSTYTAGTTGTNLPCGSMSTGSSGDLIWAAIFQGESVAPTVGSGYTLNNNNAGSADWWSEYKTQASSGAINPNWTGGTNSFDNWVSCLAMK
jgi:hypothetical protein